MGPAYAAGKEAELAYVCVGNLPGTVGDRENTYCPGCEGPLIELQGFHILRNRMNGNACPDCGRAIPGVLEGSPPQRSTDGGLPRALRIR